MDRGVAGCAGEDSELAFDLLIVPSSEYLSKSFSVRRRRELVSQNTEKILLEYLTFFVVVEVR